MAGSWAIRGRHTLERCATLRNLQHNSLTIWITLFPTIVLILRRQRHATAQTFRSTGSIQSGEQYAPRERVWSLALTKRGSRTRDTTATRLWTRGIPAFPGPREREDSEISAKHLSAST